MVSNTLLLDTNGSVSGYKEMNTIPLLSSLPEPSLYLIEGLIGVLAPETSPDPKNRTSSKTFKRKPQEKGDTEVIKTMFQSHRINDSRFGKP